MVSRFEAAVNSGSIYSRADNSKYIRGPSDSSSSDLSPKKDLKQAISGIGDLASAAFTELSKLGKSLPGTSPQSKQAEQNLKTDQLAQNSMQDLKQAEEQTQQIAELNNNQADDPLKLFGPTEEPPPPPPEEDFGAAELA